MTDNDRTCPWKLLGVSPWDSPAVIRQAWRALVRSYHPDLAGTDREAANRKLAEINAAFDAVTERDSIIRRAEELRRAQAEKRAAAARRAEAQRRAEAARRMEEERTARAEMARMTLIRSASWNRADLLAARTARIAFEKALRVFESKPQSVCPTVYL